MKFVKSYTLSPETQAEVDKVISEMKEKYAFADGIIMESQFDAGPFFEHELKEALAEDEND